MLFGTLEGHLLRDALRGPAGVVQRRVHGALHDAGLQEDGQAGRGDHGGHSVRRDWVPGRTLAGSAPRTVDHCGVPVAGDHPGRVPGLHVRLAVLRRFDVVRAGRKRLRVSGLVPVLLAGMALAAVLAGPVESAVFGGSFPQWLYQDLGVRLDQRNSIIIAFGLGVRRDSDHVLDRRGCLVGSAAQPHGCFDGGGCQPLADAVAQSSCLRPVRGFSPES